MPIDLKTTFNTAAELYDNRRPTYPRALFDKILQDTQLSPGAELLEIGPGTGQATRPMAERGFAVTAVELGDELADKARQELAAFPNVTIITGAFEDVVLPEKHYDLVYSATAFHWLRADTKFAKSHALLKPDGYLAIIHTEHLSDEQGDDFFYASTPLYNKYRGDGKQKGAFRLPRLRDLQPPELDPALFKQVSFTAFPVAITYNSQEYIELLATYSPQLAMPPAKRTAFLEQLKSLMDSGFGGKIDKHYGMTLTIGKAI